MDAKPYVLWSFGSQNAVQGTSAETVLVRSVVLYYLHCTFMQTYTDVENLEIF